VAVWLSTGTGGHAHRPSDVAVIYSDDGGSGRPVPVVEPGPSGYSDLAIGPDGTVYCFKERGGITGNHCEKGNQRRDDPPDPRRLC
jgi:hypothetical protein